MTVKIQACEKSEPDKIFVGLYSKSHTKIHHVYILNTHLFVIKVYHNICS